MAFRIPYPNPDPATGQWDAFALKRNLDFLAAAVSSVSVGGGNVIATSLDEATCTNSAVDLHTITGLEIAAGDGAIIYGNYRKTSGAGATASLGLKINASQIINNYAVTSASNQNEDGFFRFTIYARATNYVSPAVAEAFNGISNASYPGYASASIGAVTISSLAITGITGSASVGLGVRNVVVLRLSFSSLA